MYSEQEKKYYIKREQEDARGSIKIIRRDFYDDLPRAVCEVLDNISWRWRNYDWFEEAWNKYREHVITSSAGGLAIKAPGFIFNDYIDEQIKENFLDRAELEVLHCDSELTELFHHGIKGQKWGIRRYQNADGSLTEAGKQRYGVESVSDIKPNSKVEKLYQKDITSSGQAQRDILKEGKNIADTLANQMTPKQGSKKVNKKDYSKISDEELRKKVNRLSLERQYGDLTGDNKYVMTGKEVTREILQTIGAVAGIAGSAVGIALAVKQLRG